MRLTFYGGAGEVTGSRHLLETDSARVLLDCGLFQGHRREAIEKNRRFHFPADQLNAVILSHAHIDHSGSLPLLVKSGYSGAIHSTGPTAELCGVMLPDSGRLQEEDANFFNRIHSADGQRIEPLYTQADAEKTLTQFVPHAYGEVLTLGQGVICRLMNAGHILGSSMIQVDLAAPQGHRRLLFTGDLGRRNTLLMAPPAAIPDVDYLLIESTYGDHRHEPMGNAEDALAEVIDRAVKERGKILIPSFALERTQEIIIILEKLRRTGRLPAIPIVVDSPMAVSISEIFRKHLDSLYFSPELKTYTGATTDALGFESVRYVRSIDESKSLNDMPGPMVIISASGMCEGGRILHHLRNNIEKENTTILLVGYQAEGTLGRRLSEGAKRVRIFGVEHEVGARVQKMSFFSAHADQDDLLWFIDQLKPRPQKIFLVHGDPSDRRALKELLQNKGMNGIECPEYGQSFELD